MLDKFKVLIKCDRCGKNAFELHHIDYNKQNSRANNLITLCHSCHCATNYSRGFWSGLIKSILIYIKKGA